MYRSWAYILMIAATLVGVVALLWPSPPVRTIEDIASVEQAAPARAEAPAKAPKAPKPAPAAKAPAKPAPPPVVDRMPAANTLAKRAAPVLQNGLQPNLFGKPAGEAAPPAAVAKPAAKPGAPVSARPVLPPRPAPGADRPEGAAAER
jgi:hypothetical protein